MKKRSSAVVPLGTAADWIRKAMAVLGRDQVTLYAAEAAFFVLMSWFPFLMMLLAIAQRVLIVTQIDPAGFLMMFVPEQFREEMDALIDSFMKSGSISLLSVSTVTTLWSASRGLSSLDRGLHAVYALPQEKGFFRRALRSLFHTVVLLLLITATMILLVFGAQIADAVMSIIPALEEPITALMNARDLLLFLTLTLFFTMEQLFVVHGNRRTPILPGAMLSAGGWIAFSYLYSLYVRTFPRAAYLYGGLAMLLMMMLWLYACMIIFLCGAECNRLLARLCR